jgi:hypothetical protein
MALPGCIDRRQRSGSSGPDPPYTASSSRRPNMGVGGNVVWFVQHSGGGDGADDNQVLVVLSQSCRGRVRWGSHDPKATAPRCRLGL